MRLAGGIDASAREFLGEVSRRRPLRLPEGSHLPLRRGGFGERRRRFAALITKGRLCGQFHWGYKKGALYWDSAPGVSNI